MKFTLLEVFDAFVVVDNDSGKTVRLLELDDNRVSLSFNDDGIVYEDVFDCDQIVKADGDTFTAETEKPEGLASSIWDFRALTVVRLNDRPELR